MILSSNKGILRTKPTFETQDKSWGHHMAYERLLIPLVHLRPNKENDRHGPLLSEPNCILWMLENLGKEIVNLAKDIAERGLSPIDGVLVLPNPDSTTEYVVWEGNRRITALKLLDDPNRCPDPSLRRKFADIASKANTPVPSDIECTITPSVEQADRLIELRHQGPQDGIGTLILLPLKLRPPLRHGPEWTEEVARWQQKQSNPLNGGRPNDGWR